MDIRNRFGTTRLYLDEYDGESKYCLEADSGDIIVFLDQNLLTTMNVELNTLCGNLNYKALKPPYGFNSSNNPQLTKATTITSSTETQDGLPKSRPSDLYIKTRDGDVTIEKTM